MVPASCQRGAGAGSSSRGPGGCWPGLAAGPMGVAGSSSKEVEGCCPGPAAGLPGAGSSSRVVEGCSALTSPAPAAAGSTSRGPEGCPVPAGSAPAAAGSTSRACRQGIHPDDHSFKGPDMKGQERPIQKCMHFRPQHIELPSAGSYKEPSAQSIQDVTKGSEAYAGGEGDCGDGGGGCIQYGLRKA